jgi:hypothetical protein
VSDFAPHIGLVARAVWGEPNARLSTRHDMRFGTNGSKSVDLRKGVWRDHETDEGGGVLDLLRITKGLTTAGAFRFLEELGVQMPRRDEPQPSVEYNRGKIVATYDYHDANGEVLFQVCRLDPKDFRQRKPDGRGGWEWGAKGVPLVPYRLPELIDDLAASRRVFIVEGEKAVDYLRAQGIPATTNPMGAKKWRTETSEWFTEAEVVIVRDNDKAGREHGDLVAESLKGVASSILILDPPVKEKGGLDDWLAANSVEALEGMLKANAYEPGKAPFRSRYGALTLQDIRATRPVFKWVVKNVIPENCFGAINGQPACGKSFLALDLAFHIAVLSKLNPEITWFGHRVVPGGVVYVAPEGQQGFVKRVHALIKHYAVPEGDYPFVLLPTAIDLRSPEGDTKPLLAEIKAHASKMTVPLSLVIIDTLNRAMAGGDENSSADMGSFVSNAEKIRQETSASVVPVHHMNAAGERERGHSSFRGAWDFGVIVHRDETGNSFSISKQKDGEEGGRHAFHLESVRVGVDDDGDDITTCIVIPDHQNDAALTPAKKLAEGTVVAYRALVACCDEQGRGLPIQGVQATGVTLRQWGDWMRRNDVPDTSDEAHRKAMKRAMDALQVAGKIGVRDGFVWPIFKASRA